MGKNVFTEIKCHSLLPLDDVVKMVCHKDTIPEVKDALVNFLTHCYIGKTNYHPSVEKDLSLKIEVRDQTIWTSTLEL